MGLGGVGGMSMRALRRILPEFDGHTDPPLPLGRAIASWQQPVRAAPNANSRRVDTLMRDQIIPLFAQVEGAPPWPSNSTWYMTVRGYVHSGFVQPVQDAPNPEVVESVQPPGFWAEVCVPVAYARWGPSEESPVSRRMYYETVYRVIGAVQDETGAWWYRLQEGITWAPGPYVQAWALRELTRDALAPISPGRDDKWIQIRIAQQDMTCFEGEDPVLYTRIASGVPDKATPHGEFRVLFKRHARRMIGDTFDLIGVPFPVYFTWSGVAIHGTYWHNDYGRRHSSGCINVPSQIARWVFRWVDPVAEYEVYTEEAEPGEGTPVVVI